MKGKSEKESKKKWHQFTSRIRLQKEITSKCFIYTQEEELCLLAECGVHLVTSCVVYVEGFVGRGRVDGVIGGVFQCGDWGRIVVEDRLEKMTGKLYQGDKKWWHTCNTVIRTQIYVCLTSLICCVKRVTSMFLPVEVSPLSKAVKHKVQQRLFSLLSICSYWWLTADNMGITHK